MTAYTWVTGVSGDWSTATDWTPAAVPDSAAADVVIDALPAAGTSNYTVTIAPGESEVVDSIALNVTNNLGGVNPPAGSPYSGAILAVDGTLTFAPGSAGGIGGPLQSIIQLTNGTIVNAGTIDAFVQTSGISMFTGTNGIYFTNWLQSQGATVVDTASIAEYTAATKTLFDGIWQSDGDGTYIDLGGVGGEDIDIVTLQGPKAVPTTDYWTQLIFTGATSAIDEWNGTTYVPVESSITTIGLDGIITVEGGRDYDTANTLTILADGLFEQTSGTLQTAGLTIAAGGMLTSGLEAPQNGTFTASTDAGPATVVGSITNDGTVSAWGGGMDLTGPVTGTGTLTYGTTGASTLTVNSVAAGQTVDMLNSDTLTLASPTTFKGAIDVTGTGDQLNVAAGYSASISGDTLQISAGSTVVNSIALSGNVSGLSVTTPGLTVIDTTTGAALAADAQAYTGPVAGLTEQYINVTADSLAIKASTPGWFLHSGSGNDALQVTSGTNVLDGSTGSNFLVGGTGTDTFFVDDRGATASIWSTVVNFHAGDAATVWGVTPSTFALNWFDNLGATGYTGLTLSATSPGTPGATLTLAGLTSAALTNGTLSISFGTDPSSNSPYMLIQATG